MEYQWLSSWFVRAQGGSSIFFPDFKIRLRFFWIFPCHRSWFCLPNWMFSGLTLQYIAASLFPLVVPYRLITLYRVHRVFSTLAVTKISVIEYYPCHNTSNILHTYNKYNNPKGCLKYFEWKSNSCEDTKCILSSHLITIFIKGFFFKNFVWPFHPLSSFYCGVD